MEVVKGSDCTFYGIAYLDDAKTLLAPLAGATIKLFVKARDRDSDAQALHTILGSVSDVATSEFQASMPAAITNELLYTKLWVEVVIKLADMKYIRSGAREVTLIQNVGKVLF